MAYVRKFKTAAELSAFRSQIAKNRKNNRGGRKPGSPNKNPAVHEPVRTLTVRQSDYDVIVKCAFTAEKTIVNFMHLVAEGLKKRNPQIFGEDAPTVKA